MTLETVIDWLATIFVVGAGWIAAAVIVASALCILIRRRNRQSPEPDDFPTPTEEPRT